ncbi:hypothetical protein HNQ02_000676 [Flavobacterium sp. 7E]|nr:hypothetical protein [Flavobacterium sp. 7E]
MYLSKIKIFRQIAENRNLIPTKKIIFVYNHILITDVTIINLKLFPLKYGLC